MAPADFDEASSHYEEMVDEAVAALGGESSDYYLRLKADEIVRHLRRLGKDPAEREALDVGCGTGRIVELLSESFRRVQGVEPSAGMLARAQERPLPRDTFHRGQAEKLPFPEASFDLVLSTCIFHHSSQDHHLAMLHEMRRVLRPGGWIFIFEHNPWNPLTRWVVSHCPLDAGVTLYSALQIRRAYRLAGFQTPQVRFIAFFPKFLKVFRRLEPALSWLPFGGQYYLCGRKPF
ncbi:MAG: class I SAM-dependent methyltransferase [Elusimicrobia bacterium]|nr:class I SAM-dependent methyltransferase [Elusimicrobiota bacterium]